MPGSGRAHAKEYFPELLLPVSLSSRWATATPASAGDPPTLAGNQGALSVMFYWIIPQWSGGVSEVWGTRTPNHAEPRIVKMWVPPRWKWWLYLWTSLSHQETCTSLLDSLIHQRADSRSKKNYSPAACGTKTTFTERETRWKGRRLCTRWRNKIKPQKNN